MIHSLVYLLAFLASFSYAFPLHFHKHELEKRQVVTRVHTASTTNTVTDFYSTTTKIVVAPTVEFFVSGSVTYTTTLCPAGVDPTVQPTATITTVLQVKNVDGASAVGGNQDLHTTTEASAAVQSTSTTNAATTAIASTELVTSNGGTYTVATPVNAQTTTSSTQPEAVQSQDHQVQSSTDVAQTTSSMMNAIDESVVYTSQVSQPPAQVHSESSITVGTNEPKSTDAGATPDAPGANTPVAATKPTTATPVATPSADHTTSSSASANTPTEAETTSETSTTSTAALETGATSSSGNQLGGRVPVALTYSPYNSDGTCRSADNVYKDLQLIKASGVSQVRIYGTDCNSLQTVQPACAKLGIKINQGLWIGSSGVTSIDNGVKAIIEYGQKNGWDIFEYITIGNEAIISGFCSVSDLISKIQSVKAQLKAAGYPGLVTTSEPPVTFENHPELCTSSGIDFVGVNPHSYFNSEIEAANSGAFVKGQVDLIKKTCGTSNVVVTETGYPSNGNANGKNIPSAANQKLAIESILKELNGQVTILSYFNDVWKNPGPYGIEQSFGCETLLG